MNRSKMNLLVTMENHGLLKYYSKHVEFFNYINQKQKSPLYFEIVENGIIMFIGEWGVYKKFLQYYKKATRKQEKKYEDIKDQIREELIYTYKVRDPPYTIKITSNSIPMQLLIEIVGFVIGANTDIFDLKSKITKDGAKLILTLDSLDGLLNYFNAFHKRFSDLKEVMESLNV